MANLLLHTVEQHTHVPDAPLEKREQAAQWAAIKVFVANFIAMSQDAARIPYTTQTTLHGIEQVSPPSPLEVTEHYIE